MPGPRGTLNWEDSLSGIGSGPIIGGRPGNNEVVVIDAQARYGIVPGRNSSDFIDQTDAFNQIQDDYESSAALRSAGRIRIDFPAGFIGTRKFSIFKPENFEQQIEFVGAGYYNYGTVFVPPAGFAASDFDEALLTWESRGQVLNSVSVRNMLFWNLNGVAPAHMWGGFIFGNYALGANNTGNVDGPMMDRVGFRDFPAGQLWTKGGCTNFTTALQYANLGTIWTRRNGAGPCYKATGQHGPFSIDTLIAGGRGKGNADGYAIVVDADIRTLPAAASFATKTLTFTAPHFLQTGDSLRWATNQPGGLAATTLYYVTRIDARTVRLCLTLEQSYVGDSSDLPNITSAGTGTPTVNFGLTSVGPVQIEFGRIHANDNQYTLSANQAGDVYVGRFFVEETNNLVWANSADTRVHIQSVGRAIAQNSGTLAGSVAFAIQNSEARILVGGGTAGLVNWESLMGSYDGATFTANGAGSAGVRFSKDGLHSFRNQAFRTIGEALDRLGDIGTVVPDAGPPIKINLLGRVNTQIRVEANGTDATPAALQYIEATCERGDKILIRVGGGTGQFFAIDVRGNGTNSNISSANVNADQTRFPAGAVIELTACVEFSNAARWFISSVRMPSQTVSWALGTGTLAAGASVTTSITANGARVGDLQPLMSLAGAIPAGCILTGELGLNTITARITNTLSAVSGALPGTVSVFAVQQR